MNKNKFNLKTFSLIMLFGLTMSLSTIIIVSLFFVYQNIELRKEFTEKEGIITLFSFEKEIRGYFYNFDDTLDDIARLGEIEKINYNAVENGFDEGASQLRKNLEFKQMNFLDRIAKLFFYVPTEYLEKNIIHPNMFIPSDNLIKANNELIFIKSAWYDATMSSNQGEIVTSGPYKDKYTSEIVYSFSKKIYDDYGIFSGISVIDVEFKRKNAFFREVSNNLNSSLIICDINGNVLFANNDILEKWNIFDKYRSLLTVKNDILKSNAPIWINNDKEKEYIGIKYNKELNLCFIVQGEYNKDSILLNIKELYNKTYNIVFYLILIFIFFIAVYFRLAKDYNNEYNIFFDIVSSRNFDKKINNRDIEDNNSSIIRISEIKSAKDAIVLFRYNFYQYKKSMLEKYKELYNKVIAFRSYIDILIGKLIYLRDFIQEKKITFSRLSNENNNAINEVKLSMHYSEKINMLILDYNVELEKMSISLNMFKDNIISLDYNVVDKTNVITQIYSDLKNTNNAIDSNFIEVRNYIRSIENYENIVENIIAKIRLLVINASIEVGRDKTNVSNESYLLMIEEIKENTDALGEYILFTKRDFVNANTVLSNLNSYFNDTSVLLKNLDETNSEIRFSAKSNYEKVDQYSKTGLDILEQKNNVATVVKDIKEYQEKMINHNEMFSKRFEAIKDMIGSYDDKNQAFLNEFDFIFKEFKTFKEKLNDFTTKIEEKEKDL